MGQRDQCAQRGGGWQIHQVVADAVAARQFAFAEQPDFGRESSAVAPIVRGRDPDGTEAGAPRRDACRCATRRVATGAAFAWPPTRALRRCACRAATRRRVRGRPLPVSGGGRLERRRPQKHFEIGRHPQRIGQLGAMQHASQRRVVAKLRIADHGRDGKARRAHLAQQRQAPTAISARTAPSRESVPAPAGAGSATPRADTASRPAATPARPVHSATVTAVWQFAILPRAPQYCRATPTEAVPCFGKLVPSRIRTPRALRHPRAQPLPHRLGVPRRMRDEMLERLIASRDR